MTKFLPPYLNSESAGRFGNKRWQLPPSTVGEGGSAELLLGTSLGYVLFAARSNSSQGQW